MSDSWWPRHEAIHYSLMLNAVTYPHGWVILMGGSALYDANGGKDLDILAYPNAPSASVRELLGLLPTPYRITDVDVAKVICWEVEGDEVELIVMTQLPKDLAEVFREKGGIELDLPEEC